MKTFLRKTGIITIFFLIANLLLANAAFGQATVTTDKDDYAPGEYVIITGTGWQPGETISFHFDETPKPATCVNSHNIVAVADVDGNIYNNQFLIKINHLGVAFVLNATGLSSGLTATAYFTDANLSPASGGTLISADKATNGTAPAFTLLTTITFTENNGSGKSDFATTLNQIVLTAPSGWNFQQIGVSVIKTGADITSIGTITYTATTITIPITVGNTNTNDQIVISGVAVRATNAASVPGLGNITVTSNVLITGIASGASAGPLSQAPGALATFVISAPTTVTVGTAFSTTSTAKDFYGNTVTSFTGTTGMITNAGSISALTSGTFSAGVRTQDYTVTQAGANKTITAASGAASGSSNTFTVNKAAATITLGSLSQTYDGTTKAAAATTNPVGLTGVSFSYTEGGSPVASPTDAGTYQVTATLINDNYTAPNVTGSLVIGKAAATITMDAATLSATYDGTVKTVTATTNPSGLTGVSITYAASATAPTNAGTYHCSFID